MDVAEKANGLTTSAFYSLGRNDLLSNILYSGCSAGELLILLTSLARTSIRLPAPPFPEEDFSPGRPAVRGFY